MGYEGWLKNERDKDKSNAQFSCNLVKVEHTDLNFVNKIEYLSKTLNEDRHLMPEPYTECDPDGVRFENYRI